MKIAIVFLVVAVSSCNGLGGLGVDVIKVDDVAKPDGVPEVPDVSNVDVNAVDLPPLPDLLNACLIKALTGSQELLLRLALLICTYENGVDKLNDDNWDAVYESLKQVLGKTGCVVSDALGIENLEKLGTSTATILEKLVKLLRPLLDESGLSEAAFKALCELTKKMLKPTCLPLLIGGDVPKLLIDLKTQACPGINREIFYDDLYSILDRLRCLLSDESLDLDEVINNISTDDTGDLVYSGPAKPVGDIIVNVICALVEIILPNPLP